MNFENAFIEENNARILSGFSYQQRHCIENNERVKTEKIDKAKDLLLDIYNRFDVSSVQRAIDLGLNVGYSDKLYKIIEKEMLAEAIFLNLSGCKGGLAKFHWLTAKGLKVINKPVFKQGSGGKGSKHLFLQRYLKKYLPFYFIRYLPTCI